ncbi:PaaI family thioesterase [Aquincola sp. MAHUQ-54]|uniref:PaaI family thioesterase n=1 Tax=Aquincola agrisoli TaxID=3119538 RepID=A0AAW9QER0_9BURK
MDIANAFLEHLGTRLVAWETGFCRLELDIEPRHLNRQSSLQGGVTATLLDAACGYAGLITDADGQPVNALTLMLSISYHARAQEGLLIAEGRVTGGGRRIYFASAELRTADGRLVATAQGTFKRS